MQNRADRGDRQRRVIACGFLWESEAVAGYHAALPVTPFARRAAGDLHDGGGGHRAGPSDPPQPRRWPVDTRRVPPMLFDSRYPCLNVDDTLWLGALMLASGVEVDVIPDALDDVMAAYFRLFRPLVQA